ncbi:MAG: flagellar export protein FliJ [Planctomycetes bacterium]|jgi:flagellar export protein FliJ|nr:flagellar export protein FliJ [Planctomycetota bacterium]
MRRFRFRLAPLLRLRAQFERASRRELAAAMGVLAGIDQKLAAAAQGLRECAEQGARPDAVGQLAKALENGLRRHHWRLQKQLKEAQQRLDVVRADYTQKQKDLRTLQKLRDQQREAWRQDALRAEQAELDELSSLARAAAAASEGEEPR